MNLLHFIISTNYNQGHIIVAKPPNPPPPNLNVVALSWTAAKLLKNIDLGERGSHVSSTGVVLTFSGAYFVKCSIVVFVSSYCLERSIL